MRRADVLGGDVETRVSVTFQEAQAIERCLRAESDVRSETLERIRVIHFDRRAPRALNEVRGREHLLMVRLLERSTAPDTVVLETVRVLSDEVRRASVELPRRSLRAALRPASRAELFPDVPADYQPVLGVECTRRTWVHPSGWRLTVDRDLALHRVDPERLERTGQLSLGVPDRCVDGRAVISVSARGFVLPQWLDYVLRAGGPWDPLVDGLALVAPRPGTKVAAPELKLVQA